MAKQKLEIAIENRISMLQSILQHKCRTIYSCLGECHTRKGNIEIIFSVSYNYPKLTWNNIICNTDAIIYIHYPCLISWFQNCCLTDLANSMYPKLVEKLKREKGIDEQGNVAIFYPQETRKMLDDYILFK